MFHSPRIGAWMSAAVVALAAVAGWSHEARVTDVLPGYVTSHVVVTPGAPLTQTLYPGVDTIDGISVRPRGATGSGTVRVRLTPVDQPARVLREVTMPLGRFRRPWPVRIDFGRLDGVRTDGVSVTFILEGTPATSAALALQATEGHVQPRHRLVQDGAPLPWDLVMAISAPDATPWHRLEHGATRIGLPWWVGPLFFAGYVAAVASLVFRIGAAGAR